MADDKPFDLKTMKTITVRMADIYADLKFNARKSSGMTKESIEELAALIKKEGLLQQYCVRPLLDKPGKYSVVFGFRRHAALKLLGTETVEVKLLEPRKGKEDKAERDAYMANFVENVGREDLLPWELAERAALLRDEHGLSTAEIEAATCKSGRLINNYTRALSNLDPRVWEQGFKLIGLEEKQGNVSKPAMAKGATKPVATVDLLKLASMKKKDAKGEVIKDKDDKPVPDHEGQWQEFQYLSGMVERPKPPEPEKDEKGEGNGKEKAAMPWNDACKYIGAKRAYEAYKALDKSGERSKEWRKGAKEFVRYILGMVEECPITLPEPEKPAKKEKEKGDKAAPKAGANAAN